MRSRNAIQAPHPTAPAAVPPAVEVDRHARRRRWSRLWAASTLLWTLLRTFGVRVELQRYGVNTWVFLTIDLCSAAVLAVGTPRMVIAVVDHHRRRAVRWGLVTLVGFAVPDVYVLRATGRMPVMLIVLLAVIVAASVLATVIGLIRQVRAGRRTRSTAAHEVAA